MAAEIIVKATGKASEVASTSSSIDLDAPSVVRLDVDQSQVADLARTGDDLVVQMNDGQAVRIEDYFVQKNGVSSDLVLRDGAQRMWLAHPEVAGAGRFTLLGELGEVEGLVAAGGAAAAGAGGGFVLPAVLGLAGAGGAAAAASGGGGGGDDGDVSPPLPLADTQAPGRPTATFAANGASLSGMGEAGATVQVRGADGAIVGTATVGGDGRFTVPLTQPQANGQTVTVAQSDAAGNVSPAATVTAPDITAPPAPTASLQAGGLTVAGTGEAGATITVRDAAGQTLATVTVDAQGNFNAVLAAPQANGGTLTVTQSDVAGNISPATSLVVLDITAPAVPTASIGNGGATVIGTGEAGATVTVRDAAGQPIGSAAVGVQGTYTATLATPQANGETLTVTQRDTAGNVSPATSVVAPDTTAPAAPTASVSSDGTTVIGTGEAGATVTIVGATGQPLATASVAADGRYSATLPAGVSDGQVLAVMQRDGADNISPATAAATPDLVAPPTPVATFGLDAATLSGTGEPGATVIIHDSVGAVIGTGRVGADGDWTVTLPTPRLAGETLSVDQRDAAGNTSADTPVTVPDMTPPAGLTATIGDGGATVSGAGEAGASVAVRDPAGAVIGAAIVGADGRYVAPLSPAQTNGETLQVTQADAAGNAAAPVAVTAPDITPPSAPTGTLAVDGTILTGTGEPGATVTVRAADGSVLGSAMVTADGGFAVPLPGAQVNGQTLRFDQADAAGNVSPAVQVVAADISAPLGLVALVSADGTLVTGVGEAGATVTVRDPAGAPIGTASVGADGTYVAPLTPAQRDGQVLQVTQADAAGNVSAPAAPVAPDLTAPAAPVAVLAADGASVTGTGEIGALVVVLGRDGSPLGSAVVGADGRYVAALAVPQTNGETLSVTQADAAGNVSAATPLIAADTSAPIGLTAAVNANGTIVLGEAEAGATVTVRDSAGAAIGTAVAAANGAYAVVLTVPQTNGETVQVTQADAAGNQSGPAPALAPDLTAPAAPGLSLNAGGTEASGAGEIGATVILRDAAGTEIGRAVVGANGVYTATLTPPQADGGLVSATQADAAGNVSLPATLAAPDITAPAAPLAALDATGAVVTGTGEPGATVTVRDALGNSFGSGLVDADGAYAITLATPQIDRQPLSVVQADAAGNPSPATPLTAPDLTPPAAPLGSVSADGETVAGTGEAGATVTVLDPVGRVLGSDVVAADGRFLVTLATPQINGQLLVLTQADIAGNVSPESLAPAPDTLVNDSPAAPTASVTVDGLVVFGTGQAGATITVYGPGGAVIGTTTVDPLGHYVAPLAAAQVNGETLHVVQADAQGDVSPPATATAPDLTGPLAPTAAIDAAGLVVTGVGEAGATVTVRDAAGHPLGSATVQPGGDYIVVLGVPQRDGETLSVVQVDASDNPSAPAIVTAPDLTAPPAPLGAVAADGLSVTGTGEAGATVSVRDAGGATLGTALVADDGRFTATLATAQRNGEPLVLDQSDADGNVSPATGIVAPDTTPPPAPLASVDASGTLVTGTGEAGATISVRDPAGALLGIATVGSDGRFVVALASPQGNGERLQVSQADVAGNAGPAITATAPDFTAPPAPLGQVSGDGAQLTGTGEPGAVVTITSAAGLTLGTATVAGDGRFVATLGIPQANGQTLTLTQADAAGNVSPAGQAVAPDITAPTGLTATVNANGTLVSGTGEVGALVSVRDPGGTVIGTAMVASNGSWSALLAAPQANGQVLHVTQGDVAGNVSAPVPAPAPDLIAPVAPTATVDATGTTVSGSGEAGATVRITDPAGAVIGTALVGGDGLYTATLTTPQANGQSLGVVQSDAAGNASPDIRVTAPDITAPAAPTATINPAGTVIAGSGEPGATVEVRNAGGIVIGSGVVGAGGGYSITLASAQQSGEALTVSQHDPAGNGSPGVAITAPFDIVAFDNSATAAIDLVPVETQRALGSANYTALASLGLVNLNAQVLAIPNVQFTVQAGHRLDASFTYDATLNLGVASGYSVVVQRFDGANWVALPGATGNSSLLELGLLNGNLVAGASDLGPGTYRAFVTFDNTLGVGLLGGLSVSGADRDFTDVGAVVPAATSGNVITDPGPDGAVDRASPQTSVRSVTIGGTTTLVGGDDTVVVGQWGRLVIDRDGSYTYTPNADAGAIGRTDRFTYTLLDASDGETESATLSVRIGSPDVFGAPLAVHDSAVATASFANLVTTIPAAIDSSFTTPGAVLGTQTGRVTDSFTVEPNATATVTLSAVVAPGLSVLPSYTISVTNAAGVEVGRVQGVALTGLLGSGVTLTMTGLPSGTYSYTVTSPNTLGLGYGTNVYVAETVTHLDRYVLTGATPVQGELLGNDVLGSSFLGVKILSAGAYVEVGETPLTIAGAHGTLTIDETGHYSYQPSATLGYAAVDPVDSFSYQLVQPDGQVSTARLDVAVDINNGAVPVVPAAAVSFMVLAPEQDVVSLSLTAAHRTDAAATTDHHLAQATLGFDTLASQGSVDDLLGHYLDAQGSAGTTGHEASTVTVAADVTSAPVPVDDPLAYLAVPLVHEDERLTALHSV
ncbi:BapA/Bap/LapF family large adhesin [Sphingomonas abaci]|uniref:Putative regulator of Ras-like GTPase activity (Roadblock/LC7/MglB family) n=1 Tax=Sphingomonas abaci TaxID=237611 RepID=A0A7W7EWG0_9SPHN|nr:BapA/Bap/LapF family large adhesin [Sphingomonas abaci]MBB4616502.1 putative regulator of Ras-like GTPase activity (Roadblock/LC7/MglB family) [Sphingomonas abaci]